MKVVSLIKMCLNETYSEVCIRKHLSDNFPIQSGLKQVAALSPLLFNFALEYTIRKNHEDQVWLKLYGTPQLLAYADDVILLGGNVVTVKKNTNTLMMLVEKTKFMLLSRHQNIGQNLDIKTSIF
jgi:hypothetical protein